MTRSVIVATLAAMTLVGGTAAAVALDREAVNAAAFGAKRGKSGKGFDPVMVKAQILLDRARFSPGEIDGRAGDSVARAIRAFEEAQGLRADGKLDPETWAKLVETSSEPALTEYTITAEDVKGPFLDKLPATMEEMKGLDRLGYTSALEGLAEKFHMSPALLRALNPRQGFDKAGAAIVVADVKVERPKVKVATIEVDKSRRTLRALGKDGSLVAVYPASVGSAEKPAPSGTHKVTAVARNPTYTYNPHYRFKGVKATEGFAVKPGPNNPVGSVWIDLSAETYGIHGTAEPSKVGKSASHGCIRLTNWDAEALAAMVEKGTPVTFLDGSEPATTGSTGAPKPQPPRRPRS